MRKVTLSPWGLMLLAGCGGNTGTGGGTGGATPDQLIDQFCGKLESARRSR